ncbi:MAG: ATPase domain-containing protein [archaeon]
MGFEIISDDKELSEEIINAEEEVKDTLNEDTPDENGEKDNIPTPIVNDELTKVVSSEDIENKEEKVLTSEYAKNIDRTYEDDSKKLQDDLNNFLKSSQLGGELSTELTKFTVPTGIDLLDTISGGGLGTKFVQLVGNPGCGKSALAAKVIATTQRKYPGKFLCTYLDTEDSMTSDRLAQLGVTYPRIVPRSSLNLEDVFQIIKGFCNYKEKNGVDTPSIIVWDSLANTIPAAVESGADDSIAQRARIFSKHLPQYVKMMNKYGVLVLTINQMRTNIQTHPYAGSTQSLKYLNNSEAIPGGMAVEHNSFQLYKIKQKKDLESETYGFRGFLCVIKAVKNKLFAPNIEVTLAFDYNRGFSNFWTNYFLLDEMKYITGKAWKSLINFDKNFRIGNAPKMYKENPEFKKCFDSHVKSALKQIVDKYETKEMSDDELW